MKPNLWRSGMYCSDGFLASFLFSLISSSPTVWPVAAADSSRQNSKKQQRLEISETRFGFHTPTKTVLRSFAQLAPNIVSGRIEGILLIFECDMSVSLWPIGLGRSRERKRKNDFQRSLFQTKNENLNIFQIKVCLYIFWFQSSFR